MERAVRNLQTTLILAFVGFTLNAQPVPFTEVPANSTNFIGFGDYVYFTSKDALWRTDGTATGTFQLKSGITQADQWEMREFAREHNGDFYFVTANRTQLWRSDGTSSGTILLKTSSAGNIRIEESLDNYLFFVASDASTGQELYRTDGTTSGTTLVRDINPGAANGYSGGGVVSGNAFYFAANDGTHGRELWKTNGTTAGTVMIEDINPGSASGSGSPTLGYNGLVFFAGQTAETDLDPWVSNGTPEGTYILADITGEGYERVDAVSFKIAHDGYIYFIVQLEDLGEFTAHLWKTDASPANTTHLKEVGWSESTDALSHFRIVNDKVVFWNTYLEVDDYLWATDGTPEGTNQILWTSFIDGDLTFSEVVNGVLLFTGHSSGYPQDVYKSDGTEAGTGIFYHRKASYANGRDFTGDVTKVGDLAFFMDHDGPSQPKDESGNPHNEEDFFHLFQTDGITAYSMRTLFGVDTRGTFDIAEFNGNVVFTTYDDYPDPGGAVKQLWIYNPAAPPGAGAGKLSVETWNGVSGTHVSAIPLNTQPSSTSEISIFETPKNIGDNYGSRVRGYVIPPTTGNYTFWIASDDRSELWLSTDYTPANKRRIAYVAGWTTSRQWDKYTSQRSAPVSLVAGRKYYVEALLKEGTGADHLAVGWQLPNGTLERPIPGERLMSFSGSIDTSPRVAITFPEDGSRFNASDDVTIQASAYDIDGSIAKVEFYNGTTKLGEDATMTPYSFNWNDVPVGKYTITAKAIDNDGNTDTHSILIYVTDPAACADRGMIRQEFWTNVTGTRVSDIPTDTPPDFTQELNTFSGPASPVGDNYGSRIRGYICPPLLGEYIFWISGDDQVELWLSTDDDPANKRRIAYHTGWTQKFERDKYSTQRSAPITLEPGHRYYIEALMKEGSGADHVSVSWQTPRGFLQVPIPGTYLIPFESSQTPPTACEGTGTISVETWTGIDGTRVSSIPVNTAPDLTGTRTLFEAPTNVGSNFGSRFRGYVCVTTTGNYTFWIASDDHSELWLSTDNDPANKRLIANVAGWTAPRQWDKYTTQQSAPIALVAGQQYYIEALYKEDEGGDNMAVGWQLPNGTMERPIPGHRLSPFEDATSTMAARTSTEQELYQQINVYPNPVRSGDGELTISGYEGIDKIIETDVEIMNMTGEVVFSEKVLCGGNCGSYLMKMNEQLVPGVYIVNMKTNDVRTSKRLLVK